MAAFFYRTAAHPDEYTSVQPEILRKLRMTQ